ncbi:hypothetical protein A2422_04295 [Candidatus Woesebacteria bacterium RIFOXYC1_FULL_31_51]|uniref:GTP-binding protein n=1 Tax=Candidatus Woesebacteria bacterium GW2011_GWC2_31_9 TaxID=1618586 RepID=A0A0F9YJE3_9BACT|nr:MAG: GTP-binding protein YchF [Candidatus Woesebacteria bacterium GW2011_GWF1_31_35]KKP22767.1 MAG: GTP-binding protein [Candidatus Woesebacteria bacterium GW2011_GWC1_30_29]KKP26745.1 MAG: GTP-binding protein [Candidatus Woesebacteria bacterium GW2011_GWD1_31_12]KKP28015.1 MAG: GTP-binding protein [Candidatus Woesebacteria bacterium GW2011_GWB1_31_29]KKP31443.1 MAG: GTP-binding protein [Candidatus Woesebacteria bacterium GW2011_GWC2_31_9]KKP32191.1 MAG: GTP-binding protein [Candidatus Woes
MGLSVGIVGLPNVGKSTLFNALLKKQLAYVANFPFATIEPNIGVVPVPDERLTKLSKIYNSPIVPATVQFVDIAGLIAGASKGEGLGNKFLSHIRDVSAICHVIRVFTDPDIIKQGVVSPKDDFEIVKLELDLADQQTLENHEKKKNKDIESLPLFSKKPILIVLNIDEKDLVKAEELEGEYATKLGVLKDQVVAVSAKVESELSELSEDDQKSYLSDLGVKNSGLERLIQKAFKTLGLITFLTAGEKEVRAWTIKDGITAQEASGVIHTDFMNKFIKADICNFNDFIENNGWKNVRELGKVRSEGRDYIVKDGDVVEFKIGS